MIGGLTDRERVIFHLVAQGLPNRQIAREPVTAATRVDDSTRYDERRLFTTDLLPCDVEHDWLVAGGA